MASAFGVRGSVFDVNFARAPDRWHRPVANSTTGPGMKTIFKWLCRLVGFVVLVLLAAILFRNPILKNLAEWRLHAATGLDARIDYLHVGLTEPIVRIGNLKLYNPPESGGETFVDVPELYVEYDRGATLLGRIHLKLLRLNLAEVNIVEGKDGRTNLERLLGRQLPKSSVFSTSPAPLRNAGNSPAAQTDSAPRQTPAARGDSRGPGNAALIFTGIDTLNLTLGRVRYIPLATPSPPTELALDVKNAELKNVKSVEDVTHFILGLLANRNAEHPGLATRPTGPGNGLNQGKK